MTYKHKDGVGSDDPHGYATPTTDNKVITMYDYERRVNAAMSQANEMEKLLNEGYNIISTVKTEHMIQYVLHKPAEYDYQGDISDWGVHITKKPISYERSL